MDWANEQYVRVYTRETADDLDLSWEALAIWRALLIKFDQSGIISARNGWLSVARMTRIPVEVVERCGPELIKDGRIKAIDGGFLAPNFVDAQTTSKSDRVRQKESRDRRRAAAESQVIDPPSSISNLNNNLSQPVTSGHAVSHPSHAPSQNVTLCSADPLLTDTDPTAVLSSVPAVPAAQAGPQQIGFEAFTEKVNQATREREKKTKLPKDWVPERSTANLEAESEAKARGVDLRTELKRMHDWATGKAEKRTDWNAVWRNWTRSAKATQSTGRSALDQQFDRVAMLRAQEEQEGEQ